MRRNLFRILCPALALALLWTTAGTAPARAQEKRNLIIEQDCAGPGGTDMQAVQALMNSPGAQVLGIAPVTDVAWWD